MAREPAVLDRESTGPDGSKRPNLLAAADVTALLASLSAKAPRKTEEPVVPFFPDLAISEATTGFLILGLVSILCIFLPVGLDAVSDPMKALAGAKPDWYFLFVHGLLRFVPAGIGVSAIILGVGLLAALPWLDRNSERTPSRRPVAFSLAAALLVAVAALTYLGLAG